MTMAPLGDSAVILHVGSGLDEALLGRVRAMATALERDPPAGVTDIVPAFATITVFYDWAEIGGFAHFCAEIEKRVARADATFGSCRNSGADFQVGANSLALSPLRRLGSRRHARAGRYFNRLLATDGARTVEVPVCYGGEFGPDLGDVAAQGGLSPDEVVALHSGGSYVVQAIGFAPGFGYLGGLAEKIHTPRRATPRTLVPAGSVGIGGVLTAVYPFATPGGWNIIGRTPLRMFEATRPEPAILRAGDKVRFRAITGEEFAAWK